MQYAISYTETDVEVHACGEHAEPNLLSTGPDATHVRVSTRRDLRDVPTATLLMLVNKTAARPLTRFRDRATAEARIFELLPRLAVPFSAVAVSDAKQSEEEQTHRGVIATLLSFLERESATTIVEAVAELSALFPTRKPEGMRTTVRIQLGRLAKTTGRRVESVVEDPRGKVYRLR